METAIATTGTARRNRLADFLQRPIIQTLQLKKTDMADRPLNAPGGHRVVIVTGDERIEYTAGRTKVEGRITPAAQDALEPKLQALVKARDEAAASAIARYSIATAHAKSVFDAAMKTADDERGAAIASSVATYETACRAAILAASAPSYGQPLLPLGAA